MCTTASSVPRLMAPRNPANAATSPHSSRRNLAALSARTWIDSSAAEVSPSGHSCHARTMRMAVGPRAGADSDTHSCSTESVHEVIILLTTRSSSNDKTKPLVSGNRLLHAKNGDETMDFEVLLYQAAWIHPMDIVDAAGQSSSDL
eukprot:CAMPEP_0172829308 /NCGR_PEP_ID=MMETSP1075-20121228/21450_1 /TAXON_ID=2916 /ORGANISM="Ceratium fusus, Strain PA161109" /LENGTH=145 /DNA_ID=CAMNT_0013671427 /DNA_START=35 /DNA_END=473 /DNA_ORIENTATION=+